MNLERCDCFDEVGVVGIFKFLLGDKGVNENNIAWVEVGVLV